MPYLPHQFLRLHGFSAFDQFRHAADDTSLSHMKIGIHHVNTLVATALCACLGGIPQLFPSEMGPNRVNHEMALPYRPLSILRKRGLMVHTQRQGLTLDNLPGCWNVVATWSVSLGGESRLYEHRVTISLIQINEVSDVGF